MAALYNCVCMWGILYSILKIINLQLFDVNCGDNCPQVVACATGLGVVPIRGTDRGCAARQLLISVACLQASCTVVCCACAPVLVLAQQQQRVAQSSDWTCRASTLAPVSLALQEADRLSCN